MLDAALLLASLLSSGLGFALLALSQERHWHAVRDAPTSPPPPAWTPAAGTAGLLTALALAVTSQGPAFGALLWTLALSATAMAVALTLAWRPHALRPVSRLLR